MGCASSTPEASVLRPKTPTRPETPTKSWISEDSPLGEYRVAIRANGRRHADCQYRTIDEEGRVEKLWHCGHPKHGTIDDGRTVSGREVEVEGELYLDLGVGEVPTGPKMCVGAQAPLARKLLPMKFLHKVESVEAIQPPPYWKNSGGKEEFSERCLPETEAIAQIQRMLDETWKAAATRDRQGDVPAGVRVCRVQRVEDSNLWRQYESEKLRLKKKWPDGCEPAGSVKTNLAMEGSSFLSRLDHDINELYCFHGTSPDGAFGIAESGFEMSLIGSHKGTAFGHGFYFAESSSKADEYSRDGSGIYAGVFALLLCRIACGTQFRITEKGDPEVKKALARGNYDSVLADREGSVGTYREFVLFSPAAIYPEYIVLYEHTSSSPIVPL